jgi:hypothetical protein
MFLQKVDFTRQVRFSRTIDLHQVVEIPFDMKVLSAAVAASLCIASVDAWVTPRSLVVQPHALRAAAAGVPRSRAVLPARAVAPSPRRRASAVVTRAAATPGLDCDPYDPESSEYCTVEDDGVGVNMRTIKLTVLFGLWYILNIAYNIGNKVVLARPAPRRGGGRI